MLKHTLSVPIEETPHQMLCLHTSLPAHQLAFRINKSLHIKLKRDREDLDAKNNTEQYPVFSYCCDKEKTHWRLIANKIHTTRVFGNGESLFDSSESTQYLFNSLSSVDFLLDSDTIDTDFIQKRLQNDPMIQSCYTLPKRLGFIKQQLSF